MSRYRRSKTAGATYFFTLVTYWRQGILCDKPIRQALRSTIIDTRVKYPFTLDAWILLPDHLHAIWTLPPSDPNSVVCWTVIKQGVNSVLFSLLSLNQSKFTKSLIKAAMQEIDSKASGTD
jgi:putative transposase